MALSIFLVELSIEASGFIQNIFVGQNMDTEHYSIYGLCYSYIVFEYVFGAIAATGTQAAIVTLLAKKKKQEAQGTFFLSIVTVITISIVVIILVNIFSDNIAWVLGARDEAIILLPETSAFLKIISFSTPAFCLSMVLPQVALLQDGQKYIFVSAASFLVLTIFACILNFWIIDGGLISLAVIYVISIYLSLILLLVHFLNKKKTFNLYPKKIVFKLLPPIAWQSIPDLVLGACLLSFPIIVNAVILDAQDPITGIATFAIQVSFKDLITTIPSGLCAAVLILFKLYSEKKDFKECKKVINSATKSFFLIVVPVSILIAIFSQNITNLYSQDPDTLQFASIAILGLSIFLPCFTIFRICVKIFHAINHTVVSMLLNLFGYFVFPVTFVILLTYQFDLYGLVVALPLSQIAQVVLSVLAFFVDKLIYKNKLGICALDCFILK